MKARVRQARATRWLYRIENTALKFNSEANADRQMSELRLLAAKIWRTEAPEVRRLPTITAGQGTRHGSQWASYCAGFTEIVLARHHRTILVLLHELTHALGPCHHGEKFIRLYFRLLQKYAGFHRCFLQGVAAERNIAL